MKAYLRQYLFLLKGQEKQLAVLAVFSLISVAIELVGISLIGPFVAAVAAPEAITQYSAWIDLRRFVGLNDDQDILLLLGVGIVLVFYAKAVVAFLVQRAILGFCFGHQAVLRTKLMKSYQSVPYQFHAQRNSAAYINVINNHTSLYTFQTLIPSLRMSSEAIFLIGILLFLIYTDWVTVVGLTVVVGTVAVVFQRLVRRRLVQAGQEQLAAAEGFVKALNQGMAAFKEIRVLGKEMFFLDKLTENAELYKRAATQSQTIQVIPRYLVESAMVTFVVGVVASIVFTHQEITAGLSTLGIFGFAAIRSMSSISTIMNSTNQLRYTRRAVDELYRDLKASEVTLASNDSARRDEAGASTGNQLIFGTLELNRVNYRYPNSNANAISNLNISIRHGESVGFIGGSGAGKTTLVDLILGLLEPTGGEIRLDGQPLKIASEKWRRLVGYIPQGNCLIDDTVRRNVAFGVIDDEIDEARVQEAIHQVQLDKVIANLPDGLDTAVGERGIRLSGGQSQRISLARAFYHERQLIVLDEATAALDNDTEREIVKAIEAMKGEKTLLIIAHRLTTVQHCDSVYRLDQGRIIDRGIINDLGTYQSLVNMRKKA